MDGEVVREVTAELPGRAGGAAPDQRRTRPGPCRPGSRSPRTAGELRRAELTGPFFAAGRRRDVHGRPERLRGRCRDHRAAHRLSRRPARVRAAPGLAARRPGDPRRPRHRGRHLRRRPGAARHPHRGRRRARRAPAGHADHRRLPARLHRHPAAARPAGRPARPGAGAHRLPAAVRAGLAADGDRRLARSGGRSAAACRGSAPGDWSRPRSRSSPTAGLPSAGRCRSASSGRSRRPVPCWARWPGRLCSRSPTGGPSSGSTCCSGSGLAAGVAGSARTRRPDAVGLAPRRRRVPRARAPAGRARRAGRGRHPRPALPPAGRRPRGVTTPLVVVAVAGRRRRWWRAASPGRRGAVLPLRGLAPAGREVDVLGSALAVVVASAAWCGPSPPPTRRPSSWRTAPCCCPSPLVAGAAFVVHERRTPDPVLPLRALRPVGAWGALVVNLLVGAALVAALVDVPLFARATTTPGDQLGAALVLLRLLVAVPVGAVAGGWLCRWWPRGSSRRAGWRWQRSPSWP